MKKSNNKNVKKLLYLMLAVCAVSISMFTTVSCNDGETYAEQKEKRPMQLLVSSVAMTL